MDLFNGKIPHPTQRVFLEAMERYTVWGGQVGAAKTTAMCWKVMWLMSQTPDNLGILGRYTKKHLYTSTVDTWKRCFPAEKYGITYFGGTRTEPDGCMIPTKDPERPSRLYFVPLAQREQWPGAELGLFAIDQVEQCDKKVWTDLMTRLRRTTVPDELQMGMGTANNEGNFFWVRQMFIKKQNVAPSIAHKFRYIVAPLDENKHCLRDGYYEEMEATKTASEVKRLRFGEEDDMYGRGFPELAEGVHVRPFEFATEVPHASFILGYDQGFDVPSAFPMCAVSPGGRIWVRACHYADRMRISEHVHAIQVEAARVGFPLEPYKFRPVADAAIFASRNGDGQSIADEWPEPFVWDTAAKDRIAGFYRLKKLMELDEDGQPNLIIHPECRFLVDELQELYFDEEKPGKWQKRCLDHAYDALRYCAMAALEPWVPQPVKDLAGTFEELRQVTRRRNQHYAITAFPTRREEPFLSPLPPGVGPLRP